MDFNTNQTGCQQIFSSTSCFLFKNSSCTESADLIFLSISEKDSDASFFLHQDQEIIIAISVEYLLRPANVSLIFFKPSSA